jgi:DUF3006 family protein
MERIIKASLDRFEGEFAVIYSEDGQRYNTPAEMVVGAKAGSRLKLHIEESQIRSIEIDRKATDDARDRIRRKYERMRRANNSS